MWYSSARIPQFPWCSLLLVASACGKPGADNSAPVGVSPVTPAATTGLRPAHGRWRLSPHKLDRVVLRISHVVIRHRDAKGDPSGLTSPGWLGKVESNRTRDEAIVVARDVAERIRQDPGAFSSIAKAVSDDPVTAPWGGMLGTVSAASLPPMYLDAIAGLKAEGDVTPPFETGAGIVILKLEPAVPNEAVSGQRVVLKYAREQREAGRAGYRTRAQALELASRVASEARQSGQDFNAVVRQYSEGTDVPYGGDIGRWFTYEPMSFALGLEAIRRVPVGSITDPVDTAEGFQILKRSPGDPRERFAMSYILMTAVNPTERGAKRLLAQQAADLLRGSPERFDELRHQACCERPLVWEHGPLPGHGLEEALRKLKVGEISPTPVEADAGFYIVKRIEEPVQSANEEYSVRLPSSDTVDIGELMKHAQLSAVARTIDDLRKVALGAALDQTQQARVDEAFTWLGKEVQGAPPDLRPNLVEEFWARLQLPPAQLQALRERVLSALHDQLMR